MLQACLIKQVDELSAKVAHGYSLTTPVGVCRTLRCKECCLSAGAFDSDAFFSFDKRMDESIRGHRQRLRDRFAQRGFDGFHDYEVLELLLSYALPRIDVKPLAKRLLKQFKTLAGVFDAQSAELKQVQGIGEGGALFLSLIRQVEVRYLASDLPGRQLFDRPERVSAYLRLLVQGRGMECLGAIFVDQQHRLLIDKNPV